MPEHHDLIYGIHAVLAALHHKKGSITEIWIDGARHDARVNAVIEAAQQGRVTVHKLTRSVLQERAPHARHQGVVALCKALPVYTEDDLEQLLSSLTQSAFLLVLDGIQDPHNLGACLRSADAAGVHAVIAPRDRAVTITPAVRKVASGAVEAVPFIQVTNLARTLRELQAAGIWITGTAGDAPLALYDAQLQGPLALVLGAEGGGLRRLTREHCDQLVHIPMAGVVESLNVAVATGICLFEAVRQRRLTR